MACGDNHSLVLTNQREALAWGLNKQCQLGFDRQSYPVVHTPKKIRLLEYMNSSNTELFVQVQAKANYTVLSTVSKNVYISSTGQAKDAGELIEGFLPLMGKSPSNFHFKKLNNH